MCIVNSLIWYASQHCEPGPWCVTACVLNSCLKCISKQGGISYQGLKWELIASCQGWQIFCAACTDIIVFTIQVCLSIFLILIYLNHKYCFHVGWDTLISHSATLAKEATSHFVICLVFNNVSEIHTASVSRDKTKTPLDLVNFTVSPCILIH